MAGYEKRHQREVGNTFDWWCYSRKTVDHSFDVEQKKGYPDFTLYSLADPGQCFFVEFKGAPKYFPFSEISLEQRLFLTHGPAKAANDKSDQWSRLSFLMFMMGEDVRSLSRPRECWLFPWLDWLNEEAQFVQAGLDGVNHMQPKRLVDRAGNLRAHGRWEKYRLTYGGSKMAGWIIPPSHPFWESAWLPLQTMETIRCSSEKMLSGLRDKSSLPRTRTSPAASLTLWPATSEATPK